jgi:hypothetical protein
MKFGSEDCKTSLLGDSTRSSPKIKVNRCSKSSDSSHMFKYCNGMSDRWQIIKKHGRLAVRRCENWAPRAIHGRRVGVQTELVINLDRQTTRVFLAHSQRKVSRKRTCLSAYPRVTTPRTAERMSWYLLLSFSISFDMFQYWLKPDRINRHFTRKPTCILLLSRA